MGIRKANSGDCASIFSLECQRFAGDRWTEQQWRYELEENKFSTVLVFEEDDKLIGYIDYWILFEQATVNKICVLSSHEGKGIASLMLSEALKRIDAADCVSTSLEVRVGNRRAIRLYEKHKFSVAVKKEAYYSDGEDCFFMLRSIGDVYEK